jgi:plastocyanin
VANRNGGSKSMIIGAKKGMSSAGVAIVVLILGLGVVSVVYVTTNQSASDQLNSENQQIMALNLKLQQLASDQNSLNSSFQSLSRTLPVVDQGPTIRTVRETWYLSPSAHQDRFDPSFIVVNQGDKVRLTLIDNDSVAHDFVVGPPYDIIVNATVPGLINDLTGVTFTTNATNNSPGVKVAGVPGSVAADYNFTAAYSGIYEFVCTYHAEVGMIGYLVVLPNQAFTGLTTTTHTATGTAPQSVSVSIVEGAGGSPSIRGYAPDNITIVLGVNSTVIWTNNDVSSHTVTANDGSFDSGIISQGSSYSYTFTKPGVYEYHCRIHPWMIGTVVVKAQG